MPDGCGGTVACGTCPSGQVCGGDNACHDAATACTASGETVACLETRGDACLQCVQRARCLDPTFSFGDGACETTTGTLPHFQGTLPDGKTCSNVFALGGAETETQVCLEILGNVFANHCSMSAQNSFQVPQDHCLCGAVNTDACLAGTVAPIGPTYDLYACGFNTTDATAIDQVFTEPGIGAGRANDIAGCAWIFGCPCF
jgi:hypothetical protein